MDRFFRLWRWDGIGLPRTLDEVRFRDVSAAIVVALTIFGYVDVGPHGRIDARRLDRHKTDFTVYTEAAAALFDGRDPYRVTSPRGWYYLYPPLFALAVSPLTAFDTESQVLAWYALNVSLAFACFVEARRLWRLLARPGRASPIGVGIAAFLAVVVPTLDCFQRGQVGVLLLYFLMLGSRLAIGSRGAAGWLAGGVALALPAVLKLVPALPVACLLVQFWVAAIRPGRRARAAIVTAGVALGASVFLLAIPASALGWRKNLDYLHTWMTEVVTHRDLGRRSNFDIHSPRNQSLSNAVHQWIDPERSRLGRDIPRGAATWARRAVDATRALVLAVLAGLVLAAGRRDRPIDQALGFSLACAATLLISPIAWGHYYMIELPALIVLPLWLGDKRHPIMARSLVAVPALLAWAHYLFLKYVAGLGLLGLGTTAWFLAACGAVALGWSGEDLVDDAAMHVGQAEVSAAVAVGQALVVDAE